MKTTPFAKMILVVALCALVIGGLWGNPIANASSVPDNSPRSVEFLCPDSAPGLMASDLLSLDVLVSLPGLDVLPCYDPL